MSSGMPITQYRPKIEIGSQPTDSFDATPRTYLPYTERDTSSKARDSTIVKTPVARLPRHTSIHRITHSSQLTQVFGRLLYEKRLREEDLRGLREDKLKSIRSLAKFFAEDAA